MQTSQHADIKACSMLGCICAQLYTPLLECQYALNYLVYIHMFCARGTSSHSQSQVHYCITAEIQRRRNFGCHGHETD